jgi:hypothetical protein
MRRNILENKIAYAATVSLFTAALAWNIVHGGSHAVPAHMLLPLEGSDAEVVRVAHGPTMPPDPWEGVRVAHGPTMPPDPWEGVRVAHGPTMPPDPWEGLSASIA